MFRRYPVTIFIVLLSIITAGIPALAPALQLDFALVADGQWWRLITGHFTHHGFSHLFWDLIMFAVLSAACEHRHRKHYLITMLVSLLGISAAIAVFCPTIETYRGLSGIDTGLFVWFILDQARDAFRGGNRTMCAVSAMAVIALLGKLIYELQTGGTLFVESDTFTPLVQSHLAGAFTGAISFALSCIHRSPTRHALASDSRPSRSRAHHRTRTPINSPIVGPITNR
ncbi:rhombosortase [Rubripirellula amarantea]|nr:rhombosortase [Rubripirellula amarantea]